MANLVESRPKSEQEMGLGMPPLVLDLTRLMPGPLAAQILHRMGLRVLPITAPTEDLLLQFAPDVYDQLQAGKETQMLDLNTTEDRELLLKMVRKAALLIESNRPETMERRLGVGPELLRAVQPKVLVPQITCGREDIGQTGLRGARRQFLRDRPQRRRRCRQETAKRRKEVS